MTLENGLTYKMTDYGAIMITGCDKDAVNIEIPSKIEGLPVTEINYGAFSECKNLKNITIPTTVNYIGRKAFAECTGLTEISIPDTVTTIDEEAFRRCTNLEKIHLPNRFKYIDQYTFEGCKSLTEITVPYRVSFISHSAFSACTSLTSITIQKKVTEISYNAFGGCYSLTDVYYTGTEEEWEQIIIYELNDRNAILNSVTMHYDVPEIVDVHTYTPDTSWFDEENPQENYNISNVEQLAGLAKLVNDGSTMGGISFHLTNDIKMNDTSNFAN